MVISLALLLARCCCISMLLLSFANVATNVNTAVVVATDSSSTPRGTWRNDRNGQGNTDPCILSHVAPREGWTQKSTRSGGLTCAYHLNIGQPDHQHLVQLNLTLGSLPDMLQIPGLPTSAFVPPNNKDKSQLDSQTSPDSRPDTLSPSTNEHSQKQKSIILHHSPSSTSDTRIGGDEKETNKTSSAHSTDLTAGSSQHGSASSTSVLLSGHAKNVSHDEVNYSGDSESSDKNDNTYNNKDASIQSSKGLRKDLPTVEASVVSTSFVGEDHSLATSPFCVLKLIVQGPHGNQPQNVCLRNNSGEELSQIIYYYLDALNLTVLWNPDFGSSVYLAYTMVPAAGVKCSPKCGRSHLCLLESQMCDSHPDCPDGTDETKKTCHDIKSPPQPQHDQSSLNIILIVTFVVVLVVLAMCGCFMLRRNRCQLNVFTTGDALLRQQQRPHSHSSEMYRSPSGSMQDTGGPCDQRVALLHDRHHQASSSHSNHQHHGQPSPQAGFTNSHQPSSLPSHHHHHHHQPLSSYFRPPQSSVSQCNGNDSHASRHFLSQGGVSKSPTSSLGCPRTYPPHIAMSRDGEEGYKASQQALQSSHQQHQNWLVQNEVFRAPPNKTIYDRDSPPPPYSFSPPTSTKNQESLVLGMGGVSIPRLVCGNNNNSNQNNNNNNVGKCKNRGSSSPSSVPARCQVSCTPSPTSIHPPNRLSTAGPPPDYHQVAATYPQSGQSPSDLSVPLPNQQDLSAITPPVLVSSEGPFSPLGPTVFCSLSPLSNSSNTFVVTNGSPSVCPGPDMPTATHHSAGGGGFCSETAGDNSCSPTASWPSIIVPSSQISSPNTEPSLLSSSSSSHVLVPTPMSTLTSSAFPCRLDSSPRLAVATTIPSHGLESQVSGLRCNHNNINNNNSNNVNINNNLHLNDNNINSNSVNNGRVVNNSNNNNFCKKNNNDVKHVANDSGLGSGDSFAPTSNKGHSLPPTAPVTSHVSASSHNAVTTTTLSLPSHHQHLEPHRPIHNQPARQKQPSRHEVIHSASFDAAHHNASRLPPSPSPPNAVTNLENYDHSPRVDSGLGHLSESNGNVFLGHEPSLSAIATSLPIVARVSDPNGNNSEVQMARDDCGVPSSPVEGCPRTAMMDPNDNCDWSENVKALSTSPVVSLPADPWSKNVEALSTSPVVSLPADPRTDCPPCCDNTSTTSSTSSSSALVRGQNTSVDGDDNGWLRKKDYSETVEGRDLVTKGRHSPACTAAQERVE